MTRFVMTKSVMTRLVMTVFVITKFVMTKSVMTQKYYARSVTPPGCFGVFGVLVEKYHKNPG